MHHITSIFVFQNTFLKACISSYSAKSTLITWTTSNLQTTQLSLSPKINSSQLNFFTDPVEQHQKQLTQLTQFTHLIFFPPRCIHCNVAQPTLRLARLGHQCLASSLGGDGHFSLAVAVHMLLGQWGTSLQGVMIWVSTKVLVSSVSALLFCTMGLGERTHKWLPNFYGLLFWGLRRKSDQLTRLGSPTRSHWTSTVKMMIRPRKKEMAGETN